MQSQTLPVILFLATLFGKALCGFLNVSIDDTTGDPTTGARIAYGPTSAWTSSTTPCAVSQIQDDETFNKTWHSAVYTADVDSVWASTSFTGNAVYVWGILSPCSNVGDAIIGFTIDGQPMGKFRHSSGNSSTFQYGVLLFSTTGLNNTNHTLVMGVGGGSQTAYAMLDSISYTTFVEDQPTSTAPPSATKSSPNTTSSRSSTSTFGVSTTTRLTSGPPFSDQSATPSAGAAGNSSASADGSQSTTTSSSQVSTGTLVGGLVGGCAAVAAAFILARWIWAVRQKKTLSDLEERYQYIDRDDLDCKSVEMREEVKRRDPSILNIARMRESVLRSSKKLFPVMLLPSRDSFPSTQR